MGHEIPSHQPHLQRDFLCQGKNVCDSLSKILAPIRYRSVDTVQSSGPSCNVSPPLLFKGPRTEALVPPNTGCPLSPNVSIIRSATLFREPSGFWASVAYHFSSDPSRRNDQCSLRNLSAYAATFEEFCRQVSSLPFVVHRHEDDSMFEIVLADSCPSPSCFGLHGETSACCVLRKSSTRTRLVLHS